jgi:hypothetical protein
MYERLKKLWEIVGRWEAVEQVQVKTKPFYEVSFDDILSLIDEATIFQEDLRKEYKELADLLDPYVVSMHLFKAQIIFWKDLRQDFIKIRHWNEIFKLLKKPQLMSDKNFTLEEILTLRIDERSTDIRYIIE